MFRLIHFRSDTAFWPFAESAHANRALLPRALAAIFITARRAGASLLSELSARRAMQALANLDERMLRDIGLERDQIGAATWHGREALSRSLDARADIVRWS